MTKLLYFVQLLIYLTALEETSHLNSIHYLLRIYKYLKKDDGGASKTII